jgi:hypothetical protein
MAMSSVTVVGNSVLLGRYKPKLLTKNTLRQKTNFHDTENEKEEYLLTK